MIYVNQLGHSEVGRGETLEEALIDTELSISDVPKYWPNTKNHVDGDIVWVDEPDTDYNT